MFYKHFKGKYYQTVTKALDTITDEVVVIYRTLYPSDYAWFTRPAAEFYGEKKLADGTLVRRFAPIEKDQLPEDVQKYIATHPVQNFL